MEKDDAKYIYEVLSELYPKFHTTKQKAEIYVYKLMEMDYQQVMTNVMEYATKSPFPPKLADIAVVSNNTKEDNQHLKKFEEWKKEAMKVPDKTKQEFKKQLKELIEVKGR